MPRSAVPRVWPVTAALLGAALVVVTAACGGDAPSSPRSVAPIPSSAVRSAVDNGFIKHLATLPLQSQALTSSAIASVVQETPVARMVLKYLIECALPSEAPPVVVAAGGEDLTFYGQLGLAPHWAQGPCDVECQEWVSACLLARSNYYGVKVGIYMTGPHPALAADAAIADYPVEEGAFFGNVFEEPSREYSCRGEGVDPLMLTFRVCAQPGGLCGQGWVGACGATDGDTGLAAAAIACEPKSHPDYYSRCYNRGRAPSSGFPEASHSYERVITVRLHKTGFSPRCGGSPWPKDAPPPADPFAGNLCPAAQASCAGMACVNDDGCRDLDLVCAVHGGERPTCMAGCTNGTASSEAAQCGGEGSTCLTFGLGAAATSRCTRQCNPSVPAGAPGACPPWQVCTGYWLSKSPSFVPDKPGCAPFCRDDGDCNPGHFCNPRGATCGPPPNPAGLADGMPCAMPAVGADNPCRGLCYPIGPTPQQGICGSLLNAALTTSCPDEPAKMYPLGKMGQDALVMCLYRHCVSDSDCQSPLVCRADPGTPKLCQYPLGT